MPSMIVGAQSGGVPLVSGAPWPAGSLVKPAGGIQLVADASNSGTVYCALSGGTLSGGVTITSGGGSSSGGMRDGMPIVPGAAYFIPKVALQSGQPNIWLTVPSAISGQARIFWEAF